jgi:hypothetical protein
MAAHAHPIAKKQEATMKVRERVDHSLTLLSGIALGAGLMYIFDERSGGRRRALMRDKVIHFANDWSWRGRQRIRDLSNRAVGSIAELRSGMRDRMAEIPDYVLHDRVRAQLGHVVSHPGSLEIEARDGAVNVRGPVLSGEEEKIRHRLSGTRGVREFHVEVTTHADAGSIPGLQGRARGKRESRTA